ncbi:hypothetical protein DQ04_13451000 [Trypanosoma grayi]|uniref:hypothetical protein n=1 Tax=Trypanosoma grayi TaxID=71804 RepID=UPI0004F4797C|nr:hypothetical protein DQ04_13451000 [Trypanosoma grayi]KEG06534.1 hypothetical protein DQ04_13451000 [Trypanosoma grayi]
MMMMRYVLLACALCVCVGCGCADADNGRQLKMRHYAVHAASSESPPHAVLTADSAESEECATGSIRCVRDESVVMGVTDTEHKKCVKKGESCSVGYKPVGASSSSESGSFESQGGSHSGGVPGEQSCPEGQSICPQPKTQEEMAQQNKLEVNLLKGDGPGPQVAVECGTKEIHCPAVAGRQPAGGVCMPAATSCQGEVPKQPGDAEGEGDPSSTVLQDGALNHNLSGTPQKAERTQSTLQSVSEGGPGRGDDRISEKADESLVKAEETPEALKTVQLSKEKTSPGKQESQIISDGLNGEKENQGEKMSNGSADANPHHTSDSLGNRDTPNGGGTGAEQTSNIHKSESQATDGAGTEVDSSLADPTTTRGENGTEAAATHGQSGSSSTTAGISDATDSNPATTAAVEKVNDTKNADSSVSPVWVHAPLLLVALFAVTAVS